MHVILSYGDYSSVTYQLTDTTLLEVVHTCSAYAVVAISLAFLSYPLKKAKV